MHQEQEEEEETSSFYFPLIVSNERDENFMSIGEVRRRRRNSMNVMTSMLVIESGRNVNNF